MNLPVPVFAVDAGAIVGLLVLIFTIVGWLVNAANSQTNPPPPARPQRQPRRRPEDERIKDEIEVFLNEVRGKRTRPEAARPAPAEEVQLEVVEEPTPRESLEHRLAERQRAREAREARSMGQGGRPHLPDHLKEHHLQEHHLGRLAEEQAAAAAVVAAVPVAAVPVAVVVPPAAQPAQFTGAPLTGSTAAFSSVEAAALPQPAIATLLQSRQGIRNAIILNELLAPPKALRNRPRV